MSEETKRGFNFEKLDVWQRTVGLAAFIDDITGKFPSEEKFGITSQMRRAAVSVSSNIAEGSSRSSRQDFARFVEFAVGSLYELVSQGFIARKQGLPDDPGFHKLYSDWDELIRMPIGLRNHLRS
ncbi:MAG: four helix bundle protein [Chthoniobacterales bacterium]